MSYHHYNEGDPWPQQPPVAPEPQKPKKSHTGLWVVFGVLLALVIVVCAVGLGLSARDDKGTPVAPRDVATVQAQPSSKTATKAPAKPVAVSIGDGEFIVGKDVKAGDYKTAGADESIVQLCLWTTTKDGSVNTIIDTGALNSVKEPGLVTLKQGQHFKTDGCQPWVKQ